MCGKNAPKQAKIVEHKGVVRMSKVKEVYKEEFLLCPVCDNKTRTKVYVHTTLTNFPLFCPKCKRETVVDVEELNLTVIKALAAKD